MGFEVDLAFYGDVGVLTVFYHVRITAIEPCAGTWSAAALGFAFSCNHSV